ncbi:MAG: ECF transporter S component [Eubacteriales bacterium]|nr:ECF transporter S component [Eubacteriales bacterium]
MNEKKNAFSLNMLALIGLMAALVFVGSKIEVRIPAVLGVTRIHLGNSMCLLAGFLLGAVPGGFAAGLGSFLFDVIFWPASPVEWLITFATKFAMGFMAGLMLERKAFSGMPAAARYALCGASGALLYVVLYLLKSFVTYYFVLQNPLPAVQLMLIEKGAASLFNAVIAVILAVPIYLALSPELRRYGILQTGRQR